jgi:transposase
MEDSKRRSRRRHGTDLKRRVLDECAAPGASVAEVAMAHGLNANLVHKWRRLAGGDAVQRTCARRNEGFIPVSVTAPVVIGPDIRIELRRGAIAVNVAWPLVSSAECAAWLREILK